MSTFIQSTSPSLAKRIEKEITHEAVKEDKAVKHALKELGHLEKKDNKASKVCSNVFTSARCSFEPFSKRTLRKKRLKRRSGKRSRPSGRCRSRPRSTTTPLPWQGVVLLRQTFVTSDPLLASRLHLFQEAHAREERIHRQLERKKNEVEAAIRRKDEHEVSLGVLIARQRH